MPTSSLHFLVTSNNSITSSICLQHQNHLQHTTMFRAILAVLLAMLLVAGAPHATSTISCSDVYSLLYPCLGYFQDDDNPPSADCCNGIKSVLAMAKTGTDRRTTCSCLKTAASGVSGENIALASALPAKCGVSVPYKISPSTNCAKYVYNFRILLN